MIRRSLSIARAIVLAASVAAPLAAQVGHTPETSPFTDLRGRQALTLATGVLAPGGDPAGVGPRTGMQFSARYELLLTGPLWLQVRGTYAPQLERTLKDPLVTTGDFAVGTSTRPHAGLEVGFGLNLTGNKSWHGIVPQTHGAMGWMTGGTSQLDLGDYKFGNKFTVSYGLGARIVTGGPWEAHVDLTHLFWKYKYPTDYGPAGVNGSNAILDQNTLSPWKGNLLLSVGMSRFFFR